MQSKRVPGAMILSNTSVHHMTRRFVLEILDRAAHPDGKRGETTGDYLQNPALQPGAPMPEIATATIISLVNLFDSQSSINY